MNKMEKLSALTREQMRAFGLFGRAYYNFGYLPLLLVLEEYEELEYFDTCLKIKNTLEQVTGDENLPLKFGGAAVSAAKADFKKRGWGDRLNDYFNRVPFYALECRKFIESNYEEFKN